MGPKRSIAIASHPRLRVEGEAEKAVARLAELARLKRSVNRRLRHDLVRRFEPPYAATFHKLHVQPVASVKACYDGRRLHAVTGN